jgi:RNA polymerase sigma-70 factor (ECF subfamily)
MTEPLSDRAERPEDAAPLNALNTKFRASLLSYFARRLRDRSEVEDMVQEVFLRLAKRGGLGGIEKIGGYVFETANSVLTDRQRKRQTSRADAHEELGDGEQLDDADFSPLHVLLAREQLARATAVLLELPERTRVIFVLRRLEGMKYLDIAARLGLSVSAVEKHMARAVLHLMRRLEDK